jgi:hypothetical protein
MLTIAGFGRHEPPSDMAAKLVSAAHFAAPCVLEALAETLRASSPSARTRCGVG